MVHAAELESENFPCYSMTLIKWLKKRYFGGAGCSELACGWFGCTAIAEVDCFAFRVNHCMARRTISHI